jgi:hypothetical protein
VHELFHDTPDAYRGLVGFLQALGEQFALVELRAPRGQGALPLLDLGFPDDPQKRLRTATIVIDGVMGRLLDVERAFALHPRIAQNGAKGRLGLDLEDPLLGAKAYDLSLGARGAAVAEGRTARDRLALSAGHLAQIYFGAATARALRDRGLIAGSERAAALLDEATSGPPLFLSRLNFF